MLNFDTNRTIPLVYKLLAFIINGLKMVKEWLRIKRWIKKYQVNTNKNKRKARMAVIILGTAEFTIRNTKLDKEDHKSNDKRQKVEYSSTAHIKQCSS